jgi:hypothetical protein
MSNVNRETLQGIPGMTDAFRSFVESVRAYTRDYPELNRLIAGEESTNRQIAWAVLDAISQFNGTPHLTNYSLDDLLQRNQTMLMRRLTVICLVEQVGLLQTRNHINYSTGGINVGINDKTPMLMQWLQYFRSYTDQLLTRVKVALNIEGILGPSNSGIFSEYWSVNCTYAQF